MGKVERNCSYYDLSQNFLIHTSQVKTDRELKADLYEYIVSGVDSQYGDRQFNIAVLTSMRYSSYLGFC